MKVYPDPVRVVSIGRKVEDLLSDPNNNDWLSISTELCGGIILELLVPYCCYLFGLKLILTKCLGTHISNTREAKAFALISEEGIAKGVRRITAVTAQCAFEAMELACSLDKEISDAHNVERSSLSKVPAEYFF